jgi:hypothetical protein
MPFRLLLSFHRSVPFVPVAAAYLFLVRSMRITHLITTIALATPLQCALPQGRVFTSDKLPHASIELKPSEPPLPPKPWQLPHPGDPLYDAAKEKEIRDNKHSHLVHVFELGIFKGYANLTSDPSPEPAAKKMDSAFTPNPKLPPDAVELSSSEHGDKADYFQERQKTRPANVPADCIPVRVFQGKMLLGWTWIPKEGVAALHKPKKT